MTNLELVAKLKDIALNYKTLYVMGCFGAQMTAANKKRYTQNHEYNTRAERTKMINAASADTFGFDCVCLIKGVLWGWNGNKKATYGGASYATNGVPDIGADSMIKVCKELSTDFSNIEVGEAVWVEGHIGVYIGDGLAVECTPKWSNNVQITACNRAVAGYNRRNWTKHGKLPYIEYVETEASTEPTKPSFTETNDTWYCKKGLNQQLDRNFKSSEFDCKCSGYCEETVISKKLVKYLQQIRDYFNKPVTINSGYRCERHNKNVGGVTNSYHRSGEAADIVVKDVKPLEVARYAEKLGILGIGLYETAQDGYFVHVDVRKVKSFWYGQAQTKRDTFQEVKVEEPKEEKPTTNTNLTYKDFKVGEVVQFVGDTHYLSASSKIAKQTKAGRAKVTAIYESGTHQLHLRAINADGSYTSGVYGWVDISDVKKIASEPKVGDIVQFTGKTHYTSSTSTKGYSVKPGLAKITAISKKASHPYHLRAVTSDGKFTSGVYGWVDAKDIKLI